MHILEENLIVLDVKATTPEEAVLTVGNFLYENNLVTKQYTQSILSYFQKDINSFLLGDMTAVVHSNEFNETLDDALILIRLEHSVNFGKISNRPVRLLFGLVSTNSESDMQLHHQVLDLLHNKNAFSAMLTEKTSESLHAVLKSHILNNN